ncbi:MAG: amino acid permease [Acidobacteriota bacterium]|nr:amino acid permease [Acidobacteriota bacterium]
MTAAGDAGLVRGIRRWDLVALVLNTVIGAGIFGLPSEVFRRAGVWSLLAYLVCAGLVALILLCFAELGGRYTGTGGPYLYAREAFGPLAAFEAGWLLWLAQLTAFAALANLFVGYLGYFWPAASTGNGRTAVIVTMVVLLAALNLMGVKRAALASNIFTIAKLAPLLLFVAVGLFFLRPAHFVVTGPPAPGSFTASVLLLVFAFAGFESAGIPAGETVDPRRDAPFALLTAMAFVVLLYVAIQVVCIGTLPALAGSARPLADASLAFVGGAGATVMAAGALVSVAGTLNAIMLFAPRLLFAMAERGQVPAAVGATHPRFRTPYVAILLSAAAVLWLSLSGTFITAATMSTLIRLFIYAITCAAVPVLRRRAQAPATAFRVPAGDAVAVGALLLCAWLFAGSTFVPARNTLVAAGIGLLLYAGVRMMRGSRAGAAVS